jgi:hypothetical protein
MRGAALALFCLAGTAPAFAGPVTSYTLHLACLYDAEHVNGAVDSAISYGPKQDFSAAREGRARNASGAFVGHAVRFVGPCETTGDSGISAWTYRPGQGSTRLGLIGADDTDLQGRQASEAFSIDDAGAVVGTSRLLIGGNNPDFLNTPRHVWRFDPVAGVSTRIGPTGTFTGPTSEQRRYAGSRIAGQARRGGLAPRPT